MKLRYWFAHKFFYIIAKVFWNAQVKGLELVDSTQGVIVCSNHNSFIDPPLLGSIFPYEAYYIAKSELFSNKIFSVILKYFNAIPIKRKGFVRKTLEKSENLLQQNKNLIIFPEGSRKSNTAKAGIARIAVKTNCKIYPVQIINNQRFWDCFFRRKNLIFKFKKPFKPGWYNKFSAEGKINYKELANKILDRIKN